MFQKFLKFRLDLIFFYLFIFLMPFEKKHIFFANISFLPVSYLPWTAVEIYLSDIILGIVIIFWAMNCIIKVFRNNNRVVQLIKIIGVKIKTVRSLFFILPSLFLFIAILSTMKNGITSLEIYHLLKLFECFLLYCYILSNIDKIVKLLYIIIVFICSTIFQAILGIFQYLLQHSLNLKILGEVDLSSQIQNVAKIVVDGEKYIRAYGTLPHANIFGGYQFVGFMFLLILFFIFFYNHQIFSLLMFKNKKMFHEEHFLFFRYFKEIFLTIKKNFFLFSDLSENKKTIKKSIIMSLQSFFLSRIQDLFIIFYFFLFLIFLGIIISFSRSAWIATIVGVFYMVRFYWHKFYWIIRNFIYNSFQQKWLILWISLLFIVIVIFYPQITAKTFQTEQYGDAVISGRRIYVDISVDMFKSSPILGIGYGNFVNKLIYFNNKKTLNWWEFQPVHNIYFLILAETGILGFSSFLLFIGYLMYYTLKILNFSHLTLVTIIILGLFSIFLGILIIGLFDHYLWDIQQGMLLFWVLLGMISVILRNFGFLFTRSLVLCK